MHHVRGLVRHASRQTLRALEGQVAASAQSAPACVHHVCLQDVAGNTREVPLLHSGALLRLTEKIPRDDALAALEAVRQLLRAKRSSESSSASAASAVDSDHAHTAPTLTLYVKDTCTDTGDELTRRQRRFIAKLHGRFLSCDSHAVEEALKRWLASPPTELDDVAVAEYRGMVEALTSADTSAAIALAINPALPTLTSGASAALAALVQLHAPAAVHAFLESFASKDERAIASETSATHLALRLRKEMAREANGTAQPASLTSAAPSSSATLADLLTEAAHFNVDPGVVFPAEPAAVQRWADQFFTPAMLPAQKAACVFSQVQQRRLLPRRMAMDALSVWTLTDLERPWLKSALQPRHGSGSTDSCEETSVIVDEADVVLRNASYQLALKDPKRNLVDNRLLHTYAAALGRGDLSPLDTSFAAFLEECGECHSEGDAERPASISFTLPRLPDDVPVLRALQDLAPQCSYWRTLLSHHSKTHVRAATAPMQEIAVHVRLPASHECVDAAQNGTVPLPSVPVLYEDADVMVVDKPAGLATSRHGLSSTQVGVPTLDLISVLLATKFKGSEGLCDVFRQGQVHRLDAETTGCLLIAKTNVAADSLRHQMGTSAAFSHQSKIYHALCLVLEPTLRNVKLHDEVVDAADPKVRTRYRVVKFFAKHRVAWVECRIQQGKKHQIRRHLASRGLPILADVEHGGAACCQSMMSRVALHARSVSFVHPVTADPIIVTSPLPEDFERCLAQLR